MDKLWRTVLKATNKTQKVLPLTPHTYLLAWCIKSPLIPLSILDEKFITNYINISEKLQYFFLMSIQNSKSIMKVSQLNFLFIQLNKIISFFSDYFTRF